MFDIGSEAAEGDTSAVLAGVPDDDWTSVMRAHHRVIARAQFLEVDAIATVYLTRCAEDERLGRNEAFRGEFASAEVGFIFRCTEWTAQKVIGLAIDLRWRLRATSAEFESGKIDQARAQAISDALANVSADKVELIEQLLLNDSEALNTTKLRDKARRLIRRYDPEGSTRSRQHAEEDRDVRFRTNEDGMCSVEGTLPGPGGQIVAMRLRAMCFDVCGHDPRTFAQRRADALVALAAGAGRLDCRCGRADCTAKASARLPEPAASAEPFTASTAARTDDAAEDSATERSSEHAGAGSAAVCPNGSDGTASDDTVAAARDSHAGTAVRSETSYGGVLPPLPATTIHVGVNLTTLLGLDDLPGYLAGQGWIGPRALRAGRYPQPIWPARSPRTGRGARS